MGQQISDPRSIEELINRLEEDAQPPQEAQKEAASAEEFRAWLGIQRDGDCDNAAFMDTTTLATVKFITEWGSVPTPVALFDLATFVTTVVLYDRVFHFESSEVNHASLNLMLGSDVFRGLREPSIPAESSHRAAEGALAGLWGASRTYLEHLAAASKDSGSLYGQEVATLRDRWAKVLGRPVSDTDLFGFDSLDLDWGNWLEPSQRLPERLLEEGKRLQSGQMGLSNGDAGEGLESRGFVAESNLRSYFYDRVASRLELPYAPNTARLPIRFYWYRRAAAAKNALDKFREVEVAYRDMAGVYVAPERGNFQLPVFLATVLQRVSSLQELHEAVARLRKQAAPFRAHRREFDEAVRVGDVRVAKQIRKALKDDARILTSNVARQVALDVGMALVALLPAILGHPPTQLQVEFAIFKGFAASKGGAEIARRLGRRLFKPQYWFLTDMAASATALTNALPKISSLWGLNPQAQEVFAQRYAGLAALQYG